MTSPEYKAGYNACAAGAPRIMNPYSEGPAHFEWLAGWLECESDMRDERDLDWIEPAWDDAPKPYNPDD